VSAREREDSVNQKTGPIRVLIADDHPATRAGIRALLQEAPDVEVVGEARDGPQARHMAADLRPDVLLLDLVMPGLRPHQIEAWVRANCPGTITLILTAHDRDGYLAQALTAGVSGYLTKDEAGERLVEAIRRAARGEVLVTGEQMARADRWREEVGRRWESLTEREREVLCLVAQGLDNAALAEALGVKVRTVEHHITGILGKLGVASRLEAAVWVRDHLPGELWKSTV
jgi:NarL family two-component system response regulator LiaR